VIAPKPLTLTTARGVVEYVSEGDGVPLLALHGAMGGWDQARLLARVAAPSSCRVLALSRPGYLGTPLSSGTSPAAHADLYAAVLDALGIERVAVLAVSGGGPSAVELALRHPARCSALVLVSTIGERMTERVGLRRALTMWMAGQAWLGARLGRRLARSPERAAERAISDPMLRASTLADPHAGPLLRAALASTGDQLHRRIAGTRNDIRSGRLVDLPLEDLRTPTLVIHGTRDPVVPFERHGSVLARRISGAELLELDGGEHFAVFTHHALVRPRVAAFLARHCG
jgi:pimeloyl-ACP methyl ester carboxylesterase